MVAMVEGVEQRHPNDGMRRRQFLPGRRPVSRRSPARGSRVDERGDACRGVLNALGSESEMAGMAGYLSEFACETFGLRPKAASGVLSGFSIGKGPGRA